MIGTILLYNSVLLICYLGAIYLDKKPQYKSLSFFIVIIIITLLSCLCGFRSYNIGIDTHTYYAVFDDPDAYLSIEYGFKLLCKVSLGAHFSKELIFFTISFITNTLFVVRLFTLRTIAPMRYSIPVYYVMVYFLTFSGIRQMLAVSIAFFATYYIFERKRLIAFIILELLASSIHTSALFAMVFLILESLSRSSSKKWIIPKIILLLLSPVLIFNLYTVLYENYGYFFEKYEKEPREIGYMVFFRLILLILIIVTFYLHLDKSKRENNALVKKLFVIEFVTVSFSGIDYFFANIARIGWYCLAFTPVLYAYVLRYKSQNIAYLAIKCMIWICVGYTYVQMFLSQTNKLVPYEFFWNM